MFHLYCLDPCFELTNRNIELYNKECPLGVVCIQLFGWYFRYQCHLIHLVPRKWESDEGMGCCCCCQTVRNGKMTEISHRIELHFLLECGPAFAMATPFSHNLLWFIRSFSRRESNRFGWCLYRLSVATLTGWLLLGFCITCLSSSCYFSASHSVSSFNGHLGSPEWKSTFFV